MNMRLKSLGMSSFVRDLPSEPQLDRQVGHGRRGMDCILSEAKIAMA
jgi:hypothetical protein